jgi:transcriptional regulator with XRE-family HTH domain
LGSLSLEIGAALRRLRTERSLTLRDVADASGGTFKPTSLAGYERGERAITLERFLMLCQLYGTPAERVIDDIQRAYAGSSESEPETEIDLTALEALGSPEGALLSEFIRQVGSLRSERASGTIMLRAGDLAVLATAAGRDPEELLEELRPVMRDER